MKMTFKLVRQAADGDDNAFNEIYTHFFIDGRVKAWLVNQGILSEAEREEIISQYLWDLVQEIPKYKHPTIDFDKYMWRVFKQTFWNHVKRVGKLRERFKDLEVVMDLYSGDLENVEHHVNVEMISRQFTGKTKTVFKAMVVGLKRQDMPIIDLKPRDWDDERVTIRSALESSEYI